MKKPTRWLHLRHPGGFDDHQFAAFCAHCNIWQAFCQAVLVNWSVLPLLQGDAPYYEFFPPTLSQDRQVASLPLGGKPTLKSRSVLEDTGSRLLWQFFGIDFLLQLEEGITEDMGDGLYTNWRPALRQTK